MANQSAIAAETLDQIASLYGVESEAAGLSAEARLMLREQRARPLSNDLRAWLLEKRLKVPTGSATATSIQPPHEGAIPLASQAIVVTISFQ